jgi:hypothetical protein
VVPPVVVVDVPTKEENARIRLSKVAKGKLLSRFRKSSRETG